VPLILKGVQCWEVGVISKSTQTINTHVPFQDALEAYDLNLAGVVLSNHGGRQLDFARSGIEILVEVTEKLKEERSLTFPNEKFQLFVDGGVRRATDVLKAIALGATAGETHNSPPCSEYWYSIEWMKWEWAGLSCMPFRHMDPKEWTGPCKYYTSVYLASSCLVFLS
jgi:hypothetical protein